jgi:hypothetical protein
VYVYKQRHLCSVWQSYTTFISSFNVMYYPFHNSTLNWLSVAYRELRFLFTLYFLGHETMLLCGKWVPPTRLHGVMTQKTIILIFTAVIIIFWHNHDWPRDWGGQIMIWSCGIWCHGPVGDDSGEARGEGASSLIGNCLAFKMPEVGGWGSSGIMLSLFLKKWILYFHLYHCRANDCFNDQKYFYLVAYV